MIIQERMAVYINSLDTGNGEFLDNLERRALQDDVPIIRQDMQSFLKVLLAIHQPKKILEDCRREKLQILTLQDAAYPARLKNIFDPPMVLYYKGQLPELDANPVIGVVGTRKATPYGIQTAKRMGWQIGKCGGIVVSGMAYGIDGAATAGALSAGILCNRNVPRLSEISS